MEGRHLAQFNYARLRHPPDHPGTKGFVDGQPVIMRVAERTAGFVWTIKIGPAGTMDPPVWNDPLISVNLTVWKTFENFEFFVYKTLHHAFLKRRDEWFHEDRRPFLVMWWIPEGHVPTLDEGLDRLAMLRSDGAGPRAFDWTYGRAHFGSAAVEG